MDCCLHEQSLSQRSKPRGWGDRLSATFLTSFSDQNDLLLECHNQLKVFLLPCFVADY